MAGRRKGRKGEKNVPVAVFEDDVSGSPAAARRRRLFVGAIASNVKGMMERVRTPEPM